MTTRATITAFLAFVLLLSAVGTSVGAVHACACSTHAAARANPEQHDDSGRTIARARSSARPCCRHKAAVSVTARSGTAPYFRNACCCADHRTTPLAVTNGELAFKRSPTESVALNLFPAFGSTNRSHYRRGSITHAPPFLSDHFHATYLRNSNLRI